MVLRFASLGLLLGVCALSAPSSAGERESRRAELRLREVVERQVSDAGLAPSLQPFRLDPSLVQLRPYLEGRKTKLVCVVDLALSDREGALLASVRGNATTLGASEDETVDAAARSAVARLPQALAAATPKK